MKKRVLLVINSALVNAGVPNVVMKIVRSLKNKCVFDIAVGDDKPGYYDEEFLSFGGEIIPFRARTYESGKISFLLRGKDVYDAIDRIVKARQYDIVHCHNGYDCGPALKAAAKHGVPIRIAHSHGTYLNKGKNILARTYKHICMKWGVKYSTVRFACADVAGKTLFMGKSFENVLNPVVIGEYL